MENRLKERLTGAAILVALIVLVVPELFHGQRDAAPAGHGGSADSSRRSYVIDLKEPPASAAAPGADAAPVPPAPLASVAPALPAAAASTPAAPATAAVPVSASAASPAHATPGTGTGWSVQLGLFAQRENAQRLLQAAQSKGFAVSISGADGGGLYRVHVTGLPDRTSAENLRVRLRVAGFAAAIVAP